jgi:type I restriction enzyme R subunit
MSNFRFLHTEWKAIYLEAKEAERLTFTSPKACAVLCRSALEKAVNWLYDHDPDLERPYRDNLSALIHEQCFRNILKPSSLFGEIYLLKKLGDNAAHGSTLRKEESLVAIKNLFRFLSFVAIYYSEQEPVITPFDEKLLPAGEEKKEKQDEIKLLEQQLNLRNQQAQEERKKLEEQAELIHSLQQKLKEQEEAVKERKQEREKVVLPERAIPQLIPESVTRKIYIDLSLKEAGWNKLRMGYELEYEVKGMPASTNPTGLGFVDYVLWGDDGKPLAVVEAKKTMVDARKGKHQATLYADCLEKMHGQRPVIFYSNGFETYLWDDTFYPERQVYGFYTKDELQLMVDRRSTRADLRTFKLNENIAGRYYQKEAIQRVAEAFVKSTKEGQLKAGSRKALLVMATGSGKTRTSAAIVDMLTKCNWAKRILFLADRNALVKQAKNAFNEYLPHLSAIDLTREKEDSGTRLVFSTYPSIMNKIDSVKNNDDRFYGVGHFDLIIIDEAHRSVYQKYGAIFEYFDSLLIGLTATPKKEIDRNTYSLFEIEDDNPTHAYELDRAVEDKFLVPPKAISVPVKFLREGIKYHELSEREKEEYEEKFGDPTTGEAPDEISGTALNKWLFNTDTVDQVLNHLMTKGLKIEGGDKLGKSIIFAKNHEHALFIEARFNKNYPEYKGKFLRVIDNYESKAQDLLERFVDPYVNKDPQIAVSVDMMDTGVDAPRVLNLVFFKQVKSYTKFWQMIGRGTRLCPDIFGPEKDKKYFMLFDYCQNLEFFDEHPDGVLGNTVISLTQKIFELRLDIIQFLREKDNITSDEKELELYYTDILHSQVKDLDKNRFQVKMNLRYVEHFRNKKNWSNLSNSNFVDIRNYISNLILPESDDHELSRRFDLIMLNLQLAIIASKDGNKLVSRVASIASQLSKVNVPEVHIKKSLLIELQSESFWNQVNAKRIEEVRIAIRDLMKYMEGDKVEKVYTTLKDEIDFANLKEIELLDWTKRLQSYKDRVESYIRKNKNHLTIHKLQNNIPITELELIALEQILFDEDIVGTKEEYQKEYGAQPLGVFIRSIVGLDIQAANAAFSEFMQRGNLRADQMTFIKNIISFLEKNGVIDKAMLFEPPFTDVNDQGLLGVFDEADAHKVISILDKINLNAGVA